MVQSKAQAMGRNINRTKLMKEEPLERRSRTVMGRMYMFFYDPKLRETLPYYDAFPLVIVVRPAPRRILWIESTLFATYPSCKTP